MQDRSGQNITPAYSAETKSKKFSGILNKFKSSVELTNEETATPGNSFTDSTCFESKVVQINPLKQNEKEVRIYT